MKTITQLSFSAFLAVFLISSAQAAGGPSARAAAAYKDISITEELTVDEPVYMAGPANTGEDCSSPSEDDIANEICVLDPVAMSNSKHRILRTALKTPKGKDLAIDVSLECGNFASVSVKSGQAKMGKMKGSSAVRVAVVVTDDTGNSYFAQPTHSEGNPGVIFCHNTTGLEATFSGIFEIGDPVEVFLVLEDKNGDGDQGQWVEVCDPAQEAVLDPDTGAVITPATEADVCDTDNPRLALGTCLFQTDTGAIMADSECFLPEELKLTSDHMSANAFNYFYPNAKDSGLHQIDVIAWLETHAERNGKSNKGTVKATIGLGSMFVETVRLVKGHTGMDDDETVKCTFDDTKDCEEIE